MGLYRFDVLSDEGRLWDPHLRPRPRIVFGADGTLNTMAFLPLLEERYSTPIRNTIPTQLSVTTDNHPVFLVTL